MLGDERRVGRLDDGELVLEPLRIAKRSHPSPRSPPTRSLPEVERLVRGDAPDDAVHHPGARTAARSRAGTRRT